MAPCQTRDGHTVAAAAGAGIMGYAGKSVTNGPITLSGNDLEVRRG